MEVRIAPDGDGGTEVTLEHSGFDPHGVDVAEYLAALASPQGWPYILSRFAAV